MNSSNYVMFDFFRWFKKHTDTDLTVDYNQYIREKIGNELQSIISVVCKTMGIDELDVVSAKRNRPLADARAVIYYFMRQRGMSFKEIGLSMGGRDHTCVISGIKRFNDLYKFDNPFKRTADEISKLLSIPINL